MAITNVSSTSRRAKRRSPPLFPCSRFHGVNKTNQVTVKKKELNIHDPCSRSVLAGLALCLFACVQVASTAGVKDKRQRYVQTGTTRINRNKRFHRACHTYKLWFAFSIIVTRGAVVRGTLLLLGFAVSPGLKPMVIAIHVFFFRADDFYANW